MAVRRRRALRVWGGVEFEADRLERAPAVDVDDDVDPLAAMQEDAIHLSGRGQEAAVGPEQVERDKLAFLTESEKQAARIAGAQDLQPQPTRGDRPAGVEPAVHHCL